MGFTSGIVIYSCCWWVVGCLVDLDPCCLLTEGVSLRGLLVVLLGHHLSWDCLFLFWGVANGKFTYIPKYNPEISKTGLY